MGRKVKVIKGRAKLISLEAIRLARQLHKDEHFIVNKEIESTHDLNDWYYLMAAQLVVSLRNDIKELSKQQKYLWQTLEEVIVELEELKEAKA